MENELHTFSQSPDEPMELNICQQVLSTGNLLEFVEISLHVLCNLHFFADLLPLLQLVIGTVILYQGWSKA